MILQINIEKRDIQVAGIVLAVILLFGLLLWFFNYRTSMATEVSPVVTVMDDAALDAKVEKLLSQKIENGEIEYLVALKDEEVPEEDVIVSVEPVASTSSDIDPLDDTVYNNGTGAHYEASRANEVAKYEAGIIAEYGSLDEYNPDLDPNHPLYNPDILDY